MDLYCPKCGEPWDNDTLHEIAKENAQEAHPPFTVGAVLDHKRGLATTYSAVAADFRLRGCEALGERHGEGLDERDRTYGLTAAEAASALYDILGDDMDGAASMLDDMGF